MAKIIQFRHPKEDAEIRRLCAELEYQTAYAYAAYLLRCPDAEAELKEWIEKTKRELKKIYPNF